MRVEERVIKLEEFAADARNSTHVLMEMIRRHDGRLDEYVEMFRVANRSIAALADAQIRTEDSLKKIVERLDKGGE